MQLPEFSIEGQSAIVTGGTRGIGRGIALVLAEAGADVCICGRTEDALGRVAAEIRALGRRCVPVPADITREDDVDRVVRSAIDGLGKVDILVNNAGMVVVKPLVPLPGLSPATAGKIPGFFDPYSLAEWRQVMDTNLTGAVLCMRAVGPHMIERQRGRVINISSINAVKAGKYRFSYDVSKAGLCQLTRSIAVEWARYNVNVNAIGSGYVATEMTEIQMGDERLRAGLLAGIPKRRLATEREVALLTAFLASPASEYMTGQTVFLDGGSTAL